MTREEAQPAWEKIVDTGFSSYNELTREQRVWFNIEPLITGGLWDHYMNNGADINSETIEDLEYLGFKSVADLLQNFNSMYFPNEVPKGTVARQERFDKFPEGQLERHIEEMDGKFWQLHDKLEQALLEHINVTGIGRE